MRTLSLSATASAVLNGSGAATAQVGPSSQGEVWYPAVVSVSAAEAAVTDEAQCKIYAGPLPIPPYYVDGTLSGSTGDSTGRAGGQTLYPGQWIFAAWSGGDPGATVTLNLSGTRVVP
jgi:hypothetical protein